MLPSKDQLTIYFAHVAYRLRDASWRSGPALRASRCATARRSSSGYATPTCW